MSYLLDTCVVSELSRPRPDSGVIAWMSEADVIEAAKTNSIASAAFVIMRMRGSEPNPGSSDLCRQGDLRSPGGMTCLSLEAEA